MQQRVPWPWRSVRLGREKEDQAHNEALAGRLLSTELADDFVIAWGVIGWRLTGPNGERWAMNARTILTPSWVISVAEAERDARRGAAVAAEIDRHMPRPRQAVAKARF
jgi:hypothetical protein